MKAIIDIMFMVIVLAVVWFFLGVAVGKRLERQKYQSEAVENGHAEYNQVNGEWQWKERK